MKKRSSSLAEDFLKSGYAVVPADDLAPLVELRRSIFLKCKEIFSHPGDDPADFFNNFHSLKITGTKLNELRMDIINYCTQNIDSGTLLFEAFHGTILDLLGPDLLVQKNTNLVIQQPLDPNPSETHRDAPANSPYEVVVWVPLVDAYRTKAMYILNREKTKEALAILDQGKDNWKDYEAFCVKNGDNPDIPFGSGLFFWTGLLHGSQINKEKETRWTLNMRYKNLFSPNGAKDPFDFFKVFRLSPLAKIGIDFQKENLLG